MTYHARVAADGTIVVPVEMLEEFGIRAGDSLVIEQSGNALVLRPEAELDTPLGRLRTAMQGYSVERFLADRKADWSE